MLTNMLWLTWMLSLSLVAVFVRVCVCGNCARALGLLNTDAQLLLCPYCCCAWVILLPSILSFSCDTPDELP
jgi:hypothetical protein